MTAPLTHTPALDGVMLAMLTHASTVDAAAVLRTLDAVAAYLRALESAVMLYGEDTADENAVATVVNDACAALYDATRANGAAPLGDHELSHALVTLLYGLSPDLGGIIAEQAMPGELAADAERVAQLRVMFATTSGGCA